MINWVPAYGPAVYFVPNSKWPPKDNLIEGRLGDYIPLPPHPQSSPLILTTVDSKNKKFKGNIYREQVWVGEQNRSSTACDLL